MEVVVVWGVVNCIVVVFDFFEIGQYFYVQVWCEYYCDYLGCNQCNVDNLEYVVGVFICCGLCKVVGYEVDGCDQCV